MGAKCFRTLKGDAHIWPTIFRRLTTDLHTGEVIDDDREVQYRSKAELYRPIPGGPRDIETVLWGNGPAEPPQDGSTLLARAPDEADDTSGGPIIEECSDSEPLTLAQPPEAVPPPPVPPVQRHPVARMPLLLMCPHNLLRDVWDHTDLVLPPTLQV